MRETDFGGRSSWRRRSLGAYLAHLFGDGSEPDGAYAQSYAYRLQAIRPFIRSVH